MLKDKEENKSWSDHRQKS